MILQFNPFIATSFTDITFHADQHAGFKCTITKFWEIDPQITSKVFYAFDDLNCIRHNKVTYWRVGDGTPDDTMTFQYERYEVGMDGGEIRIDLDHEVAGFIIEGRLELTVGDQRRVLKNGDAYRFNRRIPHRLRVIGDEPVVSISCTIPPVF